jgi:hypothetical protein
VVLGISGQRHIAQVAFRVTFQNALCKKQIDANNLPLLSHACHVTIGKECIQVTDMQHSLSRRATETDEPTKGVKALVLLVLCTMVYGHPFCRRASLFRAASLFCSVPFPCSVPFLQRPFSAASLFCASVPFLCSVPFLQRPFSVQASLFCTASLFCAASLFVFLPYSTITSESC